METQGYMDERLREKPLLSVGELRNENDFYDYLNHFLSNFRYVASIAKELTPFEGKKFSFSKDPDLRLPKDVLEPLDHMKSLLNEKLKYWQVNRVSSGNTGAAIGKLVAEGVIREYPVFTNEPDKSLKGNPIIFFENGIPYAEFLCHFSNEVNPARYRSTGENEEIVYCKIAIKLDLEQLKRLESENSDKMNYYKDLKNKREKIGSIAKQIREFDERKQSESI